MHPDFQMSDSDLHSLAADLKEDAQALQHHNRPEAMILFRLFRRCLREMNYRDLARVSPAGARN